MFSDIKVGCFNYLIQVATTSIVLQIPQICDLIWRESSFDKSS